METAEESDNIVKPLFNFDVTELLESLLELVVTVEGNVVRSLIALVHEILEGHISCFLELHVVVKCHLDEDIHGGLELEKFGGELEWVLPVIVVVHNL
jgi:hypothetical protein